MKLTRLIGVVFLLVIFFINQINAFAQSFRVPAPTGDIYVQDFAGVLSQTEILQLRSVGRTLEDRTTAQVAVLTVDTIGDIPMEEFANEAFRQYGIGRMQEDNGVLLVLAMNDRKVRIEVGYGLEGRLPDGKVGQLLDEVTIPYLQKGQANLAVIETFNVLVNEVLEEYGQEGINPPLTTGPNTMPQTQPGTGEGIGIPSWLLIIIIVVVVVLDFKFFGGFLTHMLLSIIMRGGGGGGGGGGYRGGGGGSSGGGGAGRGW